MIREYTKKPIKIKALQFQNDIVFYRQVSKIAGKIECGVDLTCNPVVFKIRTPEGVMSANIGDYIIQGVRGELYPCRKDIFEETYEKVN